MDVDKTGWSKEFVRLLWVMENNMIRITPLIAAQSKNTYLTAYP